MPDNIHVYVIAENGWFTAINLHHRLRVHPDEVVAGVVEGPGRSIVSKTYFSGLEPDEAQFDEVRRGRLRFLRSLEYANGNNACGSWRVHCRIGVRTDDGFRANVDGLVIAHLMELPPPPSPLSTVVLLAGDGDFAVATRKLRTRGWRVEGVDVPGITSNELRRSVDSIIDVAPFLDARSNERRGDVHALGNGDLPGAVQ